VLDLEPGQDSRASSQTEGKGQQGTARDGKGRQGTARDGKEANLQL